MKKQGKAVRARLDRYEILCEGAQLASTTIGLQPFQPDGTETPVSGTISVRVEGGQYVLQSPLRTREPLPVSSDFAFALGSVLGLFEPFYGGQEFDGTRIVYTRADLLQATFGPGWGRYAQAVAHCDARCGAPLLIEGLPR